MAPTKKICYYCGRSDGKHTGGCMPDAPPDTEPQRSVRDIMREAVRVVEESTRQVIGPPRTPFRTLTLADVGKAIGYHDKAGVWCSGKFIGFDRGEPDAYAIIYPYGSRVPACGRIFLKRSHLVLVEGDPA